MTENVPGSRLLGITPTENLYKLIHTGFVLQCLSVTQPIRQHKNYQAQQTSHP